MEEEEEISSSLLTNCKLTVCDKIPPDDKALITFIIDTLHFKISGVDPLVIEKDRPSSDDINRLLEALKASLLSHNRKEVQQHRDSFELEQREGNITCDSSMKIISLQAVDKHRQLTEHAEDNNCNDHRSHGVSLQAQDSNDDVHDLAKGFQTLSVKDDYDSGHEKIQIDNNLSGNKICQEHANVSLVNEKIGLLENGRSTEKLEQNSQAKYERKKQVEETEQNSLSKQDSVAQHGSENMQTLQNNPTGKENEMKCGNNNQKQDSQYMEDSSKIREKVSTDIQEVDVTKTKVTAAERNNSHQATKVSGEVNKQLNEEKKNNICESISTEKYCIKTTSHVQCEDTESRNKQIVMIQKTTLRQDSLSEQNNVPDSSKKKTSFEFTENSRQNMTDKQELSQDRKIDQANLEDMNYAKNAIERQPIVISEDAKINKDINMQMHEEDKIEDHKNDSVCRQITDSTKERFNCKNNAGSNQLNHPAVNREVDKFSEEKNENSRMSTRKVTSKQSIDTRDSQDNVDSSDSEAESKEYIKYSIKTSSLDGLKNYFKDSIYDKYFDGAKNESKGFTFRLNSSDKNAVSFLNKLKKLKVEKCDFEHKDKKYLQSAVKKIEDQIGGLVILVNGHKVEIVGLKDSVTSAKKKLISLLQSCDLKTNQDMIEKEESTATEGVLGKHSSVTQRNQETSRNENSDDERTHPLRRTQESQNETHLKEPQSRRLTQNFSSHSSSLPAGANYSGDSEGNKFRKENSDYCVRNERRTFKVNIFKTDITKLEVDCIVNAANKRLQHGGGVAKAISLAAGPALKQECEAFIFPGRQVAITDIFISTGGNLPAKCVMHAVGPKWEAYDNNNKAQCFEDLRRTVIRCLVEADRQGFTSIAFPSISAAIFKVPKEVCARCYMEAVKHFSTFNKEQTSLRKIFFVDVDETMVKVIKEHFEKNWTDPCDPHIVHRDHDFAKTHFYSPTRNAVKTIEKSWDINRLTSSSSVSAKTPGASKSSVPENKGPSGNTFSSTSDLKSKRSSVYQIGKFIFHSDSKPAFDLSSDITITVGKPFDKLSGLPDFKVSKNNKKVNELNNTYKLFNVSKPKSQHQKLLCALLPEPDNADNIKVAIGNLDAIMQSPNHKIFVQDIRKVVLTSSILYKEPDNKENQKNKNCFDRKKIGDFARCLFDYLHHLPKIAESTISITLVGSEEALPIIHKVIESRGVMPKSPEDYSAQQRARGKAREGSQYPHQGSYSEHSGHAGQSSDYPRQHRKEDIGSSVDLEKTCKICYSEKLLYQVRCCQNFMCQDCEQRLQNCPFCRSFWRILIGNQPPGTMRVCVINDCADGYEKAGVWEIEYSFPSGVQKACHPNPGAPYTGMTRKAFLPACELFLTVLKLLRLAFLRKLTFTIGHSLTMNRENSIVWNDIHHKTRLHGGPYGYPDPNYFLNITQELANKGVTFESVSAEEFDKIEEFTFHLVKYGYFTDTHLH